MLFKLLLSIVFDLSSLLLASIFQRPVMVKLEVIPIRIVTLKSFPGVFGRLHLNVKLQTWLPVKKTCCLNHPRNEQPSGACGFVIVRPFPLLFLVDGCTCCSVSGSVVCGGKPESTAEEGEGARKNPVFFK